MQVLMYYHIGESHISSEISIGVHSTILVQPEEAGSRQCAGDLIHDPPL